MGKQAQEHVNPTAAKWIAEGWEPTCQDDYEWATDTGQYADSATENVSAFPKLGDRVYWLKEHRGGYGYVERVPAMVTGLTAKRVTITYENRYEDEVTKHVTLAHIDHEEHPCAKCGHRCSIESKLCFGCSNFELGLPAHPWA